MMIRLPVFVLLLASLLVPARGASAQGTSGMMPHPITSLDLVRYGDWLKLTPQQREAVEAVHDQYKERFRALREGEVAEFLKTMHGMSDGGMPSREVMDDFVSKMDKLQGRIRSLDDSFFSQLEPLLDEAQRPQVEHLRLARARQRYRSDVYIGMGMGMQPSVDLSEIIREVELPEAAHAQVDPLMLQYERTLTRRLQDLHEASGTMMRDSINVYSDLGVEKMTPEQQADPKAMAQLMEQMQQKMVQLMEPLTKAGAEVAELNRRSCRQMGEVMPEASAAEFRARYLGKAYPEVGPLVALGREPWLERAAAWEGLTDEDRAAVVAIIADYRQSAGRLVDECIELIDAQRASFSPFNFNQHQDHYKELAKRQAKGAELTAAAMRNLESIVGEGQLSAAGPGAAGQKVLGNMAVPGPGEAGGEDAAAIAAQVSASIVGGQDSWLPAPISTSDVGGYIKRLDLDKTLQAIIRQLHGDYTAEIGAMAALKELQQANAARWTSQGNGQPHVPDEKELDHLDGLRRQAFEGIRTRDQAFFESLQSFVLPEQQAAVERLRRGRERQAYRSVSAMQMFGGGGSQESRVDLVEITQGDKLSDAERGQIEPILVTYESSVIPALQARYDAALGWQSTMDRYTAAMQGSADDQAKRMEAAFSFQKMMEEAGRPLAEAGKRMSELNRRTLDEIVAALPEARRNGFRRAYNREAFPSIYNDPASVEEHLSKALSLKDLSADQVAGLSTLANAYWIDYEAKCQKMIALSGDDYTGFMYSDPEKMKEYMAHQDELAKLRFERDEMSYRAISRLQALLTKDQVTVIGGLPKPPQDEHTNPWQ